MDHLDDVEATAAKGRMYDPSQVVLIGSHLEPMRGDQSQNDVNQASIRVDSDLVDTLSLKCSPIIETTAAGINRSTRPAVALIYAYSYEGHTYRLPKPRLMIVSGVGEPYRATAEATKTESGTLHMWRMSKHHHTVSIEIESGSLEKLVLEGNTPGNRSVTSYSAHMQLAHRGGRLT